MTELYKYPKTMHLPWSPGTTSDDKILESIDDFRDKLVVVTEKMDGENTTMYSDHIHARSLDSRHHASRSWVKQLHATIAGEIPKHWRICGESMYAEHSIHYDALPTYFLVFSIWNEKNTCLPWPATLEWCKLLGFTPVPELYRGPWNESEIKACWTGKSTYGFQQEGYVVRVLHEFTFGNFQSRVTKYVRKGHVTTTELWMNQPVKPNGLAKEKEE